MLHSGRSVRTFGLGIAILLAQSLIASKFACLYVDKRKWRWQWLFVSCHCYCRRHHYMFNLSPWGRAEKHGTWRPTMPETMTFFVDVQPIDTDLKSHLEQKGEKLRKHGFQLQPHVVILAEKVDEWESRLIAYACLHSSVFHEAATMMEAVDIALKSTFVFGLQFPAAAHTSWSFIQRAVYGISTKFDRIPSKALELMTDTAV